MEYVDFTQQTPRTADVSRTMTARRRLLRLLAMLDASPLPRSDRVRLELEAELLERFWCLKTAEEARWGRLLGAKQPIGSA